MPAYGPKGKATVLDTNHVATTRRFPAAPSASHHRGARTRATRPHTIWAAATTVKNARFSPLSRPRVAAAATLIAPAPMLARAITDRTRAGFRSDCGAGLLTASGRRVGSGTSHLGCADMVRPPSLARRFSSLAGSTHETTTGIPPIVWRLSQRPSEPLRLSEGVVMWNRSIGQQ